MALRLLLVVLLAVLALAPDPAAAGGFVALGLRGSQLGALSADGRSAAGSVVGAEVGGFRWREDRGVELLPGSLSARGISASGRYVAGSALDRDDHEVAAWWDGAEAPHRIGGLPGAAARAGVLSRAVAVSDALRVIGTANDRDDRKVAFSWTRDDGVGPLPLAGADAVSAAVGLSDDGARAYGWTRSGDARRVTVVWHNGDIDARGAPGGCTDVRGANRAATILLGIAHEGAAAIPCVWDARSGVAHAIEPDASMPAPVELLASTDDARLMAGSAGDGGHRVAIVRSAGDHVERLADFLAAHRVAVPDGWSLAAATAISADGCRIGGYGQHDGAFDSFVADICSDADAAATSSPHSMADRRRLSTLPETIP